MGKVLKHFLRSGLFLDKIQMRTIEKKPASKFATTAKANRATKTAKTTQKHLRGNHDAIDRAIPVMVKASDAEALRHLVNRYNLPLAIIAGVMAEIGASSLRSEKLAAVTGWPSSHYLWMVINRSAADFSETVPVLIDGPDLHLHSYDAKGLGREMADWLGSLIHVGLIIMAGNPSIANLTHLEPLQVFAMATAYELLS